jgi:hypothetical protein
MTPLMLPPPTSAARSRVVSVDTRRREALERLYRRREAVESLIRSLESYKDVRAADCAICVDITVARRSSSDFAQSQI